MSLRILTRPIVNRSAIIVGALALLTFPATGNAQQGTNLPLGSSTRKQAVLLPKSKGPANSATTTSRNPQQPQHRVSVAPQGGELGKGTGAEPHCREWVTKPMECPKGTNNYSGLKLSKCETLNCQQWEDSLMERLERFDHVFDPSNFYFDTHSGTVVIWENAANWRYLPLRCPLACARPPWQIPVPKELR